MRAGGGPDPVRYARRVSDEEKRLVDRLSRQGEEALGRLAEELVGNPMVGRAISSALEAREKAVQAQEAAMGALNIPSAADIERLTRRLRSVSQRLEGIEDALDRLEQKAQSVAKARRAGRGRPGPGAPPGRDRRGPGQARARPWRPPPSPCPGPRNG